MKILAPVDPSDPTSLAVIRASEMARKDDGQLTLLAVAETFQDMESLFGAEASNLLKHRASEALEDAKAIAVAVGVKPKALLRAGVSPEDVILSVAEKGEFDLVVMGTRSKKGKGRLRLGSVAAKVVAEAPCSVLVVR